MNELKIMSIAEEDEALHGVTEKWTVKQAMLMNKRNTLIFDNPRQRSYVWERFRKADLIDSILRGYPIPSFYTRRIDGVYDFLDGKQRMSAICGFLNDEYALTVMKPYAYTDDETGERKVIDITGKQFSELPIELQDIIKSYVLDVYYYDGITERQITTMFKKLNNGKPLSVKDKNIANAIDLPHLMKLGENAMFRAFYKENFIAAKKHISIIMKVWCMLNQDMMKISFESRIFNDVMANTVVSKEQGEELMKTFDMLYEVYNFIGSIIEGEKATRNMRKKLIGELHLVSFAWFVRKAVQENIEDEQLARFFCQFYGGEGKSVSDTYNSACTNSTAKNRNIRIRHTELLKAWNQFFGIDDSDIAYDDGDNQIVMNI